MKKLISCAFNIDTACVELHFTDGSIYSINCTAVENEAADNRFQRSELDYLIYNDPLAYADLILNGNPEAFLNAVTEYKPYENGIRKRECARRTPSLFHAVCLSCSLVSSASFFSFHAASSACPSSLS